MSRSILFTTLSLVLASCVFPTHIEFSPLRTRNRQFIAIGETTKEQVISRERPEGAHPLSSDPIRGSLSGIIAMQSGSDEGKIGVDKNDMGSLVPLDPVQRWGFSNVRGVSNRPLASGLR